MKRCVLDKKKDLQSIQIICSSLQIPVHNGLSHFIIHFLLYKTMIQTQQYRYFIDSLASEATKKTYAHHLEQFCRYHKIDDCVKLVGLHPSMAEAQIIEYIGHLKNKGNSFSSINVALAAILHFYLMNDDVTLNRKKISRFLGKESVKVDHVGKAYSNEQIAKMLRVCDERTKVIILLLASSGVRVGAIPSMKLKHFVFVNLSLYQISVYDGEYITFCTPETAKSLDEYLDYRERCGEKLTPNSPIIREQFERDDLLKVRNPRPIHLLTIRTLLYETLINAGITQREHLTEGQSHGKLRKDIPLAHGFRRFFNTALMNVEVHPTFKKLLMGHSVQLDEVYYDKGSDKSRAKLLEEYSKAIDALTINEENRLRKKVEELTPKSDEIKMLKVQMQQKEVKLSSMEKSFIGQQNEMDQIKQEMNNNLVMIDYTNRLSELLASKFNITERPTENDLQELRKRILKK